MKQNLKSRGAIALALGALFAAGGAIAAPTEHTEAELIQAAHDALATFKKEDPSLEQKIQSAAGYAVMPRLGKGAFILGAGGGAGVMFQDGKPTGKITTTHVSIGLQAGGQSYAELLLFEDQAAIDRFKKGESHMRASASAVLAQAGASARASYQDGMQVFVSSEGGLMHDLSIGGQTFKFEPFTTQAPGT
jgi:lipid-binding SYLF domain-containing protein